MSRQRSPALRRAARRALDRRLVPVRDALPHAVPPQRGWVQAIRESLGMSAEELGRRMGTVRTSVLRLEASEREGVVRLDTLRRAADAMDCDLVYALVPRRLLEDMVAERARFKAAALLADVGHSMALEDQQVGPAVAREQAAEQAALIADEPGLWSDD